MSSYDILQNNFPSGEISPLWKGRSNTEFYKTGLDTCTNFMPLSPSGLRRRPGTTFLRDAVNNTKAPQLIPVVINGTENAVAELYYGGVRVWYVDSEGTIAATQTSSLLQFSVLSSTGLEIDYAVNNGTIWIVRDDMKPITIAITKSGSTTSIVVSNPTFTGDYTFSTAGDYPSCVAFKGGRLFLGGTINTPNAVFASRSPDYDNGGTPRYTDFNLQEGSPETITASCAIELEDNELSKARWFVNAFRFLVGSQNYILSDDGTTVSAITFDISPMLREGTSTIKAKTLRNYVVYVGSSNKTLGIMVWSYESQQFVSSQITTNSSHLFYPGIKDFTITFMPDPIIWVLLNDNTVLSCVVDNSSGTTLTGWSKHTFANRSVERISGIPGNFEKDVLYLTVKVGNAYHIERLQLDDIFDTSETEDKIYLDMKIDCTSATEVSTFTYTTKMAGKDVTIMTDNTILCDVKVNNDGTVTLPKAVDSCTIGLRFESLAGFLSQEQPANGESSFGNKRRLRSTTLRVYQSFGGYIGTSHDSLTSMYKLLTERYGDYKYGDPITLADEDITTDIHSSNLSSVTLYLKTDMPMPLNILALKEHIEILES